MCSNSKLLETELKHLQEVLSQCKYPKWAIYRVLQQQENRSTRNRGNQGRNNTSQTEKKYHIVIPYSEGLCESYKTICSKCGIQVHFKGGNTLKNLLMFQKDREAMTECDDEYIGESARTFEERYKEHLKAPSPILNTKILLATQQQWNPLKLWEGRVKIWPGP